MYRRRFIGIILLASLLSGCTLPYIQDDYERTVTEAALTGGIGGTAIGAILGKWLDNDPLLGAIIGGVLGIVAGDMYGNHIANKKKMYHSQEAYLDACLRQTQSVIREMGNYNKYLQNELVYIDQETKRQLYLYNQKQVSKRVLTAEQQQIQEILELVVMKLEKASQEVLIEREVLRREKLSAKLSL